MNLKQYALAKLNLTLRILDKNERGYSNLESLTVFMPQIYDVIEIIEKDTPGFSLSEKSSQNIEIDSENLVVKAFNSYHQENRIGDLFPDVKDLHLELEKHIPIAAGLGGGSCDGAATFNLLNRYCDNELTISELLWKAQELGSDVSSAIYSQALWMKGTGDRVEPLDDFYLEDTLALVVVPQIECSTQAIYQHYDKMGRPTDEGIDSPSELERYCPNLHNDLSIACFDLYSEVLELKQGIEKLTDLEFMLAGSGSTLFALADQDKTTKALEIIDKSEYQNVFRLIASSELI